jgi:hypothetical protein
LSGYLPQVAQSQVIPVNPVAGVVALGGYIPAISQAIGTGITVSSWVDSVGYAKAGYVKPGYWKTVSVGTRISGHAPTVSLGQPGLSLELWLTSVTQEAVTIPKDDDLRITVMG